MSAHTTPSRSVFPFRIQAERRLEVSRGLPLATTLGAIAVALVISGILIAFIGGDPFASFAHIVGAGS